MQSTTTREPKIGAPLGIVALVFLLLAGFVLLPRIFTPRGGALTAKDAPDFTLKLIANETGPGTSGKPTITMSDLRGKAVVLDFWASWCGPCRLEAPIVDKVSQRYRDRGLVVIGVNTDDQDGAGRAWALANGISFPIVFDGASVAARAYGVETLPTLVIVSRSGKVTAVRGPTDETELERLVEKAL